MVRVTCRLVDDNSLPEIPTYYELDTGNKLQWNLHQNIVVVFYYNADQMMNYVHWQIYASSGRNVLHKSDNVWAFSFFGSPTRTISTRHVNCQPYFDNIWSYDWWSLCQVNARQACIILWSRQQWRYPPVNGGPPPLLCKHNPLAWNKTWWSPDKSDGRSGMGVTNSRVNLGDETNRLGSVEIITKC